MHISNIEVSLFSSESALFKYAITPTPFYFEKRLLLACRVTFSMCSDYLNYFQLQL